MGGASFNLERNPVVMIKKSGDKYVIKSKTSNKTLGTYKTKKEAEKRLRQIEYFKHVKK